jgi:hypothetical protein
MKQHTLLGIAAALTAFVLVVIGALVGQMSQTGAPTRCRYGHCTNRSAGQRTGCTRSHRGSADPRA